MEGTAKGWKKRKLGFEAKPFPASLMYENGRESCVLSHLICFLRRVSCHILRSDSRPVVLTVVIVFPKGITHISFQQT